MDLGYGSFDRADVSSGEHVGLIGLTLAQESMLALSGLTLAHVSFVSFGRANVSSGERVSSVRAGVSPCKLC